MSRISWDDFFMGVAELAAKRSRDPNTQVGACIVKDNKIVATGYNGMARTCDEKGLPWDRTGDFLDTKYPYVVHTEMNAILNSPNTNLKDCAIYVTLFPCCECTKAILQSGINEVHYLTNKYPDQDTFVASKRMLELSGVKLIKHEYKKD